MSTRDGGDAWARPGRILLAAVAVQTAMYGGHFSFTVFFPSLLELAGGSRARVAGVYTVFTCVYLAFMFPVGFVADRWSPRRLVATSALVYAIGFGLSALAGSLGGLYVAFGLVAALGMSAGYVVPTATAVRCFPRRGGAAVGLVSAGVALASAVGPPVSLALIERFGWRPAFAILGAGILAVVAVASRAFPSVAVAPLLADRSRPLHSARTILAAPHSWLLGLVCATSWLPLFAIWAHLYPMGLARGLAPAAAAACVTVFGVASLVGRLGWGVFSDRRGRPLTLALCFGGQVIAFALLAGVDGASAFFAAVALYGFASGGSMSLTAVLATDLFGGASAGRIMGATAALGGAVATLGPVTAGYLYDVSGSYLVTFVLGVVLNAGAIAALGRLVALGPCPSPAPGAAADRAS